MEWSEEQVQTLRQIHLEGKPYHVIAAQLGTTRCAISGKIFRLGLSHTKEAKIKRPYKRQPVFWTKPRVVELRRLWESGVPLLSIAQIIGASDKAVAGARFRYGLKPRQSNPPRLKQPPKHVAPPIPKPLLLDCPPVTLMERTGCCYIVSETGEAFYCNNTIKKYRADGLWQYCTVHLALMQDKTAKKKSNHSGNIRKIGEKAYQTFRPYTDSDMVAA